MNEEQEKYRKLLEKRKKNLVCQKRCRGNHEKTMRDLESKLGEARDKTNEYKMLNEQLQATAAHAKLKLELLKMTKLEEIGYKEEDYDIEVIEGVPYIIERQDPK